MRKMTSLILIMLVVKLNSQTLGSLLEKLDAIPVADRQALVDSFLAVIPGLPHIEDDALVHFIYSGPGGRVSLAGDANGWSPSQTPLDNIPGTDCWYRTHSYEDDARLEYKFVIDDSDWILDPRNPRTAVGGFGPNSELRLPGYQIPPEIDYYPLIPHGEIVDTTFSSRYMGNARTIRIYLPPGYAASEVHYPLVLFHDGLDYIDLANARNVLDNLIDQQRIKPVIAVFVPPVNRNQEYAGRLQRKFTRFIIEELIPWIDVSYRTVGEPQQRAVIGASNGGNISLWLALTHPDVFGNVAAQSSNIQRKIAAGFRHRPKRDLLIYLDLGTYDIPFLIPLVRDFGAVLERRGYTYHYREYHEGHNWVFWRAHIDDALEMFFPAKALPAGTISPQRQD